MGRKRKHDRSQEEIRQKIKKLQDQLAKSTNSDVNLPEEGIDQIPLDIPNIGSMYCDSPLDTDQHELSLLSPSQSSYISRPVSPYAMPLPAAPPPPLPTFQPGTSTVCADNLKELELDEDILQLLGDAPTAETPMGQSIHKDVARRWQDILARGLPKDVKENLLKEYLVPSNCDFVLAATLNPEVKAALPEPLVKRDSSLAYKQRQIGIALSALARVTEMVISNEISKCLILKPLSDACRILCDSHYSETRTRRNFVISSINTKLKATLIETSRGKFLFGEDMAEKLKAAKTIQQSGEALKNAPRPRFQRQNVGTTIKSHLNFTPQYRKTDNIPNDVRKAHPPQRQPPNNSVRRPNERLAPQRTQAAPRK